MKVSTWFLQNVYEKQLNLYFLNLNKLFHLERFHLVSTQNSEKITFLHPVSLLKNFVGG